MVLGYILLGLLSIRPMTGYDLKAFFNNSVNFFWSAELSQIYRELSRLQRLGYIKYEQKRQDGRPDKKIYSVTESGDKVFLEWLRNFPQDLISVSRNEFLVRIFFSSRIEDDVLVEQLERYIREREAEHKVYEAIDERLNCSAEDEGKRREKLYQRLTVRRGLHFAKSEIKWAQECIEEIIKFNAQK